MAKLPLPISSSTMNIPTDLSAVLRLEGAGCCVAMVVVPGPGGSEAGTLFYNGSEDHRVR
jgi:hypothetical protein